MKLGLAILLAVLAGNDKAIVLKLRYIKAQLVFWIHFDHFGAQNQDLLIGGLLLVQHVMEVLVTQ